MKSIPIDHTRFFARLHVSGNVSAVERYVDDDDELFYIYVTVPAGFNVFRDVRESFFKIYLEGEAKEKWCGEIFANDYIYLQADIEAVQGYGCDESDYRFYGWYKSPRITVRKARDIIEVKPFKKVNEND